MTDVYVYDPTATDDLSKVRGVGRYISMLRENFKDEFKFVNTIDEVPSSSTFLNPFFDLLKSPLKLKRISRRQIAVIHDIIPLKYPKHYPVGIKGGVYKRLNRIALKRYNSIITVSEASKRDIIKLLNVPEKKVNVVYSVLNEHFNNKKTVKPAIALPKNYFIYVGDATWNKNLVNIARAIKKGTTPCIFVGKVFKTFLDVDLNQIVHPELQEIKNFLKLAKDDNKFIFPGYITDEELSYLYKNAVANILLSRDEGFGFTYFEAAAFKTPSLLADRPIFHETAGDAALFAGVGNIQDITLKLKQLLKNPELRKELGTKAYNRLKLFNVKRFKSEYREALKNSGSYEI